jgi:hypothetical protein
MRYQYTTLLFAALTTLVTANSNLRADYIPQLFNERSVRPAGGWAVGLNPDENCPDPSESCGPRWCCPSDLICHLKNATDIAAACCPAGMLPPSAHYRHIGNPATNKTNTYLNNQKSTVFLPSKGRLTARTLTGLSGTQLQIKTTLRVIFAAPKAKLVCKMETALLRIRCRVQHRWL